MIKLRKWIRLPFVAGITAKKYTFYFISPLQAGHVEEVNLGDYRRERITRAMKPLLFGKIEF